MKQSQKITVENTEIAATSIDESNYISLTDMLKAKDGEFFVSDWLRSMRSKIITLIFLFSAALAWTQGIGATVKIGNQIWTVQNLNLLPMQGNSWCYRNDEANCQKYGRLYDWAAAMSVCPAGWHLPSAEEWRELANAVGGEETAGKQLKSKSGWDDFKREGFYITADGSIAKDGTIRISNGNGTDSYGFSALPGGDYFMGRFVSIGNRGRWWSSTGDTQDYAYSWNMSHYTDKMAEVHPHKANGRSVRCVKNP
jgi:uncharacterized protein (TIGR02145 family)